MLICNAVSQKWAAKGSNFKEDNSYYTLPTVMSYTLQLPHPIENVPSAISFEQVYLAVSVVMLAAHHENSIKMAYYFRLISIFEPVTP